MIESLLIRNYALIEHLELAPGRGLSIITGETGAGKSILLGALGLLLGQRADTKVLLNETEKCVVEAGFDLSSLDLEPLFAEHELDYEAHTLIRREISPQGKSRAFVNDIPCTLEVLKEITSRLVDIHSQHDTLLLGSLPYQSQILDTLAGNKERLAAYQKAYQAWKKAQQTYEDLKTQSQQGRKDWEFQQFQLRELQAARLVAGEQEQLESSLQVLSHAEEIKARLVELLTLLDDEEGGVLLRLKQAKNTLEKLGSYSEEWQPMLERLEATRLELRDLADTVAESEERIQPNSQELARVEARLSELFALSKKHGRTQADDLLPLLDELKAQVGQFENLDEAIEQAEQALQIRRDELIAVGQELGKNRQQAAENLEVQIAELLAQVGMPHGRLKADLQTLAQPGPLGLEQVRLLFSANKGLPEQELKQVASGGEFSRLMLCLKYLLAQKSALPTIIFDEIDTGISGTVALQVADMIQEMGREHQIITITHLPQMASRGQQHYFVYKDNSGSRTRSLIRPLNAEERVAEIAQMIAGSAQSEAALESAREMLQAALNRQPA